MWSRAQLKDKAKYALKMNYWKVILVTFLVSIVLGGSTTTNGAASTGADTNMSEDGVASTWYAGQLGGTFADAFPKLDNMYMDLGWIFGIFAFAMISILIVATIIGFVYAGFIANPFQVGSKRFFLKNLRQPAEVKEVAFAFDNSYKNVATIMAYRMVYTFLWSLLFIIPGIIKAYEYQMIPYLLAENPKLTKEEAFAISKQMMDGNKWEAFVLDLSFIGWDILAGFTFGLLSIFYVGPYKHLTQAALYEELSLIHGRPGMATQTDYTEYQTENPYVQEPVYTQEVPPVPENFKVNE